MESPKKEKRKINMKEIHSPIFRVISVLVILSLVSTSFSAKADTYVKVTSLGGDTKIYSQAEMQNIADLTTQYTQLAQHIADMKALYHDMLVATVQLMQGGTDPQTVSLVGGDNPTPLAVQMAQATSDLVGAEEIINQNQEKLDVLGQALSQAQQGSGIGTLINGMSVLDSTALSSGYVITAGVNSYVTIDSGGESVTLTPGSTIYVLANKQQGVQLLNLIDGKIEVSSSSGLNGMVIVVGNKVVNHKDSSFFVERGNEEVVIGSYAGVVGITDFGDMIFYAIPENSRINFTGNETVAGAIPSKKVGVAYLSLNNTLSYSIKPFVEIAFDGPVKTETLTGALSCKNKNYTGYFFIYGNNRVVFVPNSAVENGSCTLVFSGMDFFENSFQYNLTFTTLCKVPDAEYYLFYPAVYKVRKALDINNTLEKELFSHDAKLYLLQNFSNAVVRIDSISPSNYEIKKDSLGNEYVHWSKEKKVAAGTEFSYEINYTVLSFGVNYFDFLGSGLEGAPQNAFLESTTNIQSNDEKIKSVASAITGSNTLEKAHKIANWLRLNIHYDVSMEQNEGALATLSNSTGVCNGYAALFAALGRASAIPTKYDIGILGEQGYHAFDEIYIDGKWVPVDPTGVSSVNDYFGVLYSTQLKEAELEDLSDSVELFYAYTKDGSNKVYDYTGYTFRYTRKVSLSNYSELEPLLEKLYLLLYLQDTQSQSAYFSEEFSCNYYNNAKEMNSIIEECREEGCDSERMDNKLTVEFEKLHDEMEEYAEVRINESNEAEASGYPIPLEDKTALTEAKNYIGYAEIYFNSKEYYNAIASLAYANWLLYSTTTYTVSIESNWLNLNRPDENNIVNITNPPSNLSNPEENEVEEEPTNAICGLIIFILLAVGFFFMHK